jgi:hypothetical protein
MSPPTSPTKGRVVLVEMAVASDRAETLPAIVTHVHSPLCISVVVLSAFGEAVFPGGTRPMTSVTYDPSASKANTWRWMDYQLGQAATAQQGDGALARRVGELERALVALNQKQPASQRVPVADPSLAPQGNEVIGKSASGSLVMSDPLDPKPSTDGDPEPKV